MLDLGLDYIPYDKKISLCMHNYDVILVQRGAENASQGAESRVKYGTYDDGDVFEGWPIRVTKSRGKARGHHLVV